MIVNVCIFFIRNDVFVVGFYVWDWLLWDYYGLGVLFLCFGGGLVYGLVFCIWVNVWVESYIGSVCNGYVLNKGDRGWC